MMSKSMMTAVLFSLGHAMVHDAMSPADHQLETTRQTTAHNAAMELLGAREAHIDEANQLRVTAENARHADELARIVAEKAAITAAHARATASILADRTGIHARMAAAPLFAALPSADPAVAVGGLPHPAALAAIPAALLARNTDAARFEAERHAERIVELDTARDTAIAAHDELLRQFNHEVRTNLEQTRRNGAIAEDAHQASLLNLGQRLQRHFREEREAAGAAAIVAADAARAARGARVLAARTAAIVAAGGHA